MPSAEPLLAARGITRRYGRTVVLGGVDLTLAGGEVLLLLGPNGAGKSTLLRILAGLARPDRGAVLVGGVPVAEARRRVGFLAHDTMLYDDLTVAENLAFAAELTGVSSTQAAYAAESAGLVPKLGTLVRHLSRGQVQRAALARALIHGPDLLLLDEPYTGLDAPNTARLTELLRARQAAGAGVVLVGHRPDEGWEVVTRVAMLSGGAWAFDIPRPATPAEVQTRFREVLGG
ncbi:MAG TPA: heme ABC exporter ATP-binding protein CcmA [Gemmatimonadales bacterium]|nr:heme ABC exporter ATP-binding protein CcmA [Gemmatimonadales bacterium]